MGTEMVMARNDDVGRWQLARGITLSSNTASLNPVLFAWAACQGLKAMMEVIPSWMGLYRFGIFGWIDAHEKKQALPDDQIEQPRESCTLHSCVCHEAHHNYGARAYWPIMPALDSDLQNSALF
jgi:hypothetical protein